jgi:two-component system invasion response regulator UvrY
MKIALVDDHPLLTQTLKNMFALQNNTSEIKTYNSAVAFLEDMPVYLPDITITDVLMPEMNGIQLLEYCKLMKYHTKFIVLTGYSDLHILRRAIENGALGFLSKNSLFEEITEAIEYVMKGKQYISGDLKELLVNSLLTNESDINTNLTQREQEVLTKICSGHTLKLIATDLNLSMNTIQYYHKNVMAKLKVKKTADLVVTAIQLGLYIPEQTRRV